MSKRSSKQRVVCRDVPMPLFRPRTNTYICVTMITD